MPIGILTDTLAVIAGGFIGSFLTGKLSNHISQNLNLLLGLSSLSIGIISVTGMQNLAAVILSMIIGTLLGLVFHLGDRIQRLASKIQKLIPGNGDSALIVTAIVLFCASGTGIYGSLMEGMTGDSQILIAKAILDFFTAMIFACSIGKSVCLISFMQLGVFLVLFVLAGMIVPFCTDVMLLDFKACGGIIMMATGFRMMKVKDFPIADMIPSMILVLPLSWLWINVIASVL